MALFASDSPLMIILLAVAILLAFGLVIYGISGTFFFSVSPPFIQQAATYEFRDRVKQSFYEQEQ